MNSDSTFKWQNTGAIVLSALAVGMAFTTMRVNNAPRDLPANQETGISVSGHTEIMTQPDRAYVSLGVVTRGKNVGQAISENARKAQAVTDSVRKLGIEDKDIQTRNYSIEPWVKYDKHYNATQLGYTVNNSIRVTVRRIKNASKVADAATGAGANRVNGISFGVDEEALRQKALGSAVENGRAKAEAIAKKLGVALGQPIQVSESTPSYGEASYDMHPLFMSSKMKRAMETPISPGQLKVTKDVQVTFAIER